GRIRPASSETAQFLLSCLRDSDLAVKTAAARLLCENVRTEPELIAALRSLLFESLHSPIQRSGFMLERSHHAALAAAEALGKIGPDARESIPALSQAAEDRDLRLRLEAAFAIWRIDGAGQPLTRALADAIASDDFPVLRLALQKLRSLTP